ncbi:MAG: hypothetical protein HWQ36_26160 [Nostoc sp. NMS2]|uniref:hypothetical protein n=1 Tax=Nostoc sp. NMS2 TaxID=2815389 RepID=UPI0025CF556B|nr:hypothetical protein [Nostoc sp. NMS2]MBN3993872.1 hypothetical protein [Nostoc sp. NMS2]
MKLTKSTGHYNSGQPRDDHGRWTTRGRFKNALASATKKLKITLFPDGEEFQDESGNQVYYYRNNGDKLTETPVLQKRKINTPGTTLRKGSEGKDVIISDREQVKQGFRNWRSSFPMQELNKYEHFPHAQEAVASLKEKLADPEVEKKYNKYRLELELKEALPALKKYTPNPKLNLAVDISRVSAATDIYDMYLWQGLNSNTGVKAIKNDKGELSTIYTYNKGDDHLKLEYLVSSPKNMFKETRQKGGGTQAIVDMILESKKAGFGGKIKLDALGDAIPFYEAIGFKNDGVPGYNKLTLSPENADKFLEKINQKNAK